MGAPESLWKIADTEAIAQPGIRQAALMETTLEVHSDDRTRNGIGRGTGRRTDAVDVWRGAAARAFLDC